MFREWIKNYKEKRRIKEEKEWDEMMKNIEEMLAQRRRELEQQQEEAD